MIYLSGCVRDIRHQNLGFLFTPRMGNAIPDGMWWAADNDRYGNPEGYTDEGYLGFLAARDPTNCLFATTPDVVGDHVATVALSRPMFARIRALGYKVAFVAQDGWTEETTPWDEFDVLFVGGTNTFKLGPAAKAIRAAKERGKWVHMGRVNSYRRLRVATVLGCDSADGTYLKFGPDVNEPKLLEWLSAIAREPILELR